MKRLDILWPEDEEFSANAGAKVKKGKKAKHIFSHVEWHMEGIVIETEAGDSATKNRLIQEAGKLTGTEPTAEDWAFVTPRELRETYAVPSAFEAYVKEVMGERDDGARTKR